MDIDENIVTKYLNSESSIKKLIFYICFDWYSYNVIWIQNTFTQNSFSLIWARLLFACNHFAHEAFRSSGNEHNVYRVANKVIEWGEVTECESLINLSRPDFFRLASQHIRHTVCTVTSAGRTTQTPQNYVSRPQLATEAADVIQCQRLIQSKLFIHWLSTE